jgi:adenine-specific DNA-methyltransferase
MSNNKQKLELTWIGKNNPEYDISNIEPRILEERPDLSYGDKDTENMIIHGDNLLALKALLPEYEGKVKCIYIDPPYNTGNAFEHYDDSVEHSTWLSLMKPRLELLRALLSDDGLLAVQIDDNEFAKLYILLSEVFDGQDKLKNIVVKMSEATGVKMASAKETGTIPKLKEYIILAGKNGVRNLTIEKIPKDKWDFEYKTVCLNVTKDELEIIKTVLANESRTQEEINLVDKISSKIVFANMNDVAKKEVGGLPTEEWLYENAFRIVQFATLTGGALQTAIHKKNSRNETFPFSIITPNNKAYLIKGDFNDQTRLPRCKFLFADWPGPHF